MYYKGLMILQRRPDVSGPSTATPTRVLRVDPSDRGQDHGERKRKEEEQETGTEVPRLCPPGRSLPEPVQLRGRGEQPERQHVDVPEPLPSQEGRHRRVLHLRREGVTVRAERQPHVVAAVRPGDQRDARHPEVRVVQLREVPELQQ